ATPSTAPSAVSATRCCGCQPARATAEPDASRADRKSWAMNGLNARSGGAEPVSGAAAAAAGATEGSWRGVGGVGLPTPEIASDPTQFAARENRLAAFVDGGLAQASHSAAGRSPVAGSTRGRRAGGVVK